jgi:hypothetical protein
MPWLVSQGSNRAETPVIRGEVGRQFSTPTLARMTRVVVHVTLTASLACFA